MQEVVEWASAEKRGRFSTQGTEGGQAVEPEYATECEQGWTIEKHMVGGIRCDLAFEYWKGREGGG